MHLVRGLDCLQQPSAQGWRPGAAAALRGELQHRGPKLREQGVGDVGRGGSAAQEPCALGGEPPQPQQRRRGFTRVAAGAGAGELRGRTRQNVQHRCPGARGSERPGHGLLQRWGLALWPQLRRLRLRSYRPGGVHGRSCCGGRPVHGQRGHRQAREEEREARGQQTCEAPPCRSPRLRAAVRRGRGGHWLRGGGRQRGSRACRLGSRLRHRRADTGHCRGPAYGRASACGGDGGGRGRRAVPTPQRRGGRLRVRRRQALDPRAPPLLLAAPGRRRGHRCQRTGRGGVGT
mmetsp:Transcript_125594/g.349707  ORF Transcript_125594/g.349707 Transcript_125594/m.349707 type:complete len:290 (-) Transcript_125594:7-876(-)